MNSLSEPSRAFTSHEDPYRDKGVAFFENDYKRLKLDPTTTEDPKIVQKEENASVELENYNDDILSQRNPFLMPPVLKVLFSHMDANTLKTAREVCYLWKNESLPIFKGKTEAVLNLEEICHSLCRQREENAQICLDFLNVMEEVENNDLPFENMCINMMDMRCKRRMSKIFRQYGSQISSLNILFFKPRFDDGDEDDDNLSCFFKPEDFKLILLFWCTNLKSLKLTNIPFTIAETKENIFTVKELVDRKSYTPGGPLSSITKLSLEDNREYFPLGKMIVFHVSKVSPLLTSLEINVEDDEAFDAFIDGLRKARAAGFLTNLNSLIFGRRFGCIFYENHLVSLIAMKLHKLRKLEILNMGQDLSTETLKELFFQCRDSLEVFRLDVTNFTDKSRFPNQHLYLPIMKKLKHLEIKCNSIQLFEQSNLSKQLRSLKFCTLDTNCDCGYRFTGFSWNSITLKCSEFTYFADSYSNSKQSLLPIQFHYKAHCVRSLQRIMKWLPTAKSIYVDKGEERFGLVDLFRAMSETNIEELYLKVSCQKSNRNQPCCMYKTVDEEEAEVEKLPQQTRIEVPIENECAAGHIFPELRKLKIVTHGCRNMNIDFLRVLGILHFVENAPALSNFKIKYHFKTCSKTAIIFDHQPQIFEAEQ